MSSKRTKKLLVRSPKGAGEEYSLTENEMGWSLVRMVKRTDRFYRGYMILRGDNGAPKSCSCPDWVYRGGVCKHIRAILDMTMGSVDAIRERSEPGTTTGG